MYNYRYMHALPYLLLLFLYIVRCIERSHHRCLSGLLYATVLYLVGRQDILQYASHTLHPNNSQLTCTVHVQEHQGFTTLAKAIILEQWSLLAVVLPAPVGHICTAAMHICRCSTVLCCFCNAS